MPASSTRLRIVGARVLYGKAFADAQLGVELGVLTDGALPTVNLTGYLVLPGIVDLHGDAFERHLAPRPTAPFPMRTGLIATDRDAAANGVTTAWMAQSWS
ncbi:MAG: alkylphosphonate utilization protein, partial [Pseudomonadota bacterium]